MSRLRDRLERLHRRRPTDLPPARPSARADATRATAPDPGRESGEPATGTAPDGPGNDAARGATGENARTGVVDHGSGADDARGTTDAGVDTGAVPLGARSAPAGVARSSGAAQDDHRPAADIGRGTRTCRSDAPDPPGVPPSRGGRGDSAWGRDAPRALDALRDPERARVRSVPRAAAPQLRMVRADDPGRESEPATEHGRRRTVRAAGDAAPATTRHAVPAGDGTGTRRSAAPGGPPAEARAPEEPATGEPGRMRRSAAPGADGRGFVAGPARMPFPALVHHTVAGPVHVVRTELSLSLPWGTRTLGEWIDASAPGEGTVALDLETTGLSAARGAVLAMGGLARLVDGVVCVEQSLLLAPGEEPAAVRWLAHRLERAQTVLTWNGRKFDLPFLAACAARHGLEVPDPAHEDLFLLERRARRRGRLRLVDVETRVLGFQRDDDLPGAEAPGRFHRLFDHGDLEAVRDVLVHNRDDVVSTLLLRGRVGQGDPP
ncbi:MAG: hypothetical protein EA398_01830 [Deltaproteobacteria bacterium]|nr:MAG: hypothetical protein EA398_01830 [Deltaproteobacteria bacterium]